LYHFVTGSEQDE